MKGHTKNIADRLFNLLKRIVRISNVYTFKSLVRVLSGDKKSICPVKEGEFEDWETFLNTYYRRFPSGTIQKNHIFEVSAEKPTVMRVCVADREEWTEICMTKKDDNRSQEERVAAMKSNTLNVIPSPGLKDIKKVEI